MIYINRFFFTIFKQIRKLYLYSNFYDKKISKINNKDFVYKPSPYLLSSLIKYQKKKFKIDDFSLDEMWNNNKLNNKDYKSLNSFYWFFSLDLKSSKKTTQSVVTNWIKNNYRFNNSWDFDLTAKRIISWLSCHNLTFDESNLDYRNNFNKIILKQANHLISEINRSKLIDDKLIGCASIILVGLCYDNEKDYLNFGSTLLKKISKIVLDNYGFPKSRSIKQLVFYLKYFILIREWFKESQVNIPEHIDETIFHLGQGYAFFWNSSSNFLFNGNNISDNSSFDNYLKRLGYKFKNDNQEFGGYIVLKNKKVCIIMDAGSTPTQKYTVDYQSGALSFEIISNGKKLISNCGYYNKKENRLNQLSKASATQNTLVIDDNSSCKFSKVRNTFLVKNGLKVIKKILLLKKIFGKSMLHMMDILKNIIQFMKEK